MNKKTLLFSFALILTGFAAKSQTNMGFESWQKTGIYDMPDGWTTSNILGAIFNDSASCIKSTNAYNSAYSLKMRAAKSTLSGGDVIPGVAIQTALYKKRPKTFRFDYHMKATNDTGFLSVTLYNKTLQNDTNIVGYIEYDILPNADWQQKSVDFTYNNLKSVDSVEISIFSGNNLGGYLLMDNLTLSDFASGISLQENKTVKVYPNPAKDMLTIENPGAFATTIKLTTLTGQNIFEKEVAKGNQVIDISSIKPGIYVYNLTFEDGSIPHTGKLVIQ